MTLNGAMVLILCYFTEFVYDVVVKMFTFAISSPDEFLDLVNTAEASTASWWCIF